MNFCTAMACSSMLPTASDAAMPVPMAAAEAAAPAAAACSPCRPCARSFRQLILGCAGSSNLTKTGSAHKRQPPCLPSCRSRNVDRSSSNVARATGSAAAAALHSHRPEGAEAGSDSPRRSTVAAFSPYIRLSLQSHSPRSLSAGVLPPPRRRAVGRMRAASASDCATSERVERSLCSSDQQDPGNAVVPLPSAKWWAAVAWPPTLQRKGARQIEMPCAAGPSRRSRR